MGVGDARRHSDMGPFRPKGPLWISFVASPYLGFAGSWQMAYPTLEGQLLLALLRKRVAPGSTG